ncbi:MAG: hypothetical protein HQL07_17420 [Nitrospirae bacterium]|nr:hypothetical protein [Magnetococcales bacterium]
MAVDLELIKNSTDVNGPDFQKHLLEQYKLYVEMADRISARRMLANSFFVGVHTAFIAAFTVLIKEKILDQTFFGMAPFIAVLILCLLWWLLINSYRQLNTGKFKVIHEFEKWLPAAPYDAEWKVLEEGKNRKAYWPFTHIENYIPVCFALLYIFLAVGLYFK